MFTSFTDLGVPADLVTALERKGIKTPFEVQAATIPDALAGRDVCGRAPTGSGKTLAFGIPLVARVERARPRHPRALVLAPTRELAAQIQREIEPLARARDLRVAVVYGGVGYEPQRKALRKGVEILVACPGRLADLLGQSALALSDVDIVVIDEADRMADMGFLPEVRRLLDRTAEDRQTVLFSATLDGDVAVITRDYQRDPVRHEVGAAEPDIHLAQHHFWRVEQSDRVARAADVIGAASPTIVFTRTRHGADKVAKQLGQAGVHATPIHGGRSQGQRDRALKDFQHGRVDALIATDVAARGIHVDDVACVVHFDPPVDAKTYQHRSGRTARAGASGLVVSFLSRDQVRDARQMQRVLGLSVDVTAPDAGDLTDTNGDSTVRPVRPVSLVRDDRIERDERGGDRDDRARRPARSGHRSAAVARNRGTGRAAVGAARGSARGNQSGNAGGTSSNGNAGGARSNGNAGGARAAGNTGGTSSNGNAGGARSNGNAGGTRSNGNAGGTRSSGNAGGTRSAGASGERGRRPAKTGEARSR